MFGFLFCFLPFLWFVVLDFAVLTAFDFVFTWLPCFGVCFAVLVGSSGVSGSRYIGVSLGFGLSCDLWVCVKSFFLI